MQCEWCTGFGFGGNKKKSAQTLYSGMYILYITKQGRNYCRLLRRQWYYATEMYRNTHLKLYYLRLGLYLRLVY